jgi:hypothetical protein
MRDLCFWSTQMKFTEKNKKIKENKKRAIRLFFIYPSATKLLRLLKGKRAAFEPL